MESGSGSGGRSRGTRRHLTYANVMSTLAMFLVVAGGTALAASVKKNSVSSNSIKDNAVLSKDLKNGKAVASSDVKDNSLSASDVKDGSLTGDDIADGSIATDDLGDGSVISNNLGTITRFSKVGSVPANSETGVVATCPAGSIALSGGGRSNALNMPVVGISKDNAAEAWVYDVRNDNATAQGVTAFVYCLAR